MTLAGSNTSFIINIILAIYFYKDGCNDAQLLAIIKQGFHICHSWKGLVHEPICFALVKKKFYHVSGHDSFVNLVMTLLRIRYTKYAYIRFTSISPIPSFL